MNELHKRSVMKALTWRVIATLTTVSLVYIFTNELVLSLGVGAFDIIIKLLFYYFHERAWIKVKWGKQS
mgnify:CR=1 FL=1|jgi:uncharacterized membrane protein